MARCPSGAGSSRSARSFEANRVKRFGQKSLNRLRVLGVDVVRDADTGKLYVLEINPIGDTWHFSSLAAKNFYTAEYVRALYAQFGALDRVAQLLIEKTRAEAT